MANIKLKLPFFFILLIFPVLFFPSNIYAKISRFTPTSGQDQVNDGEFCEILGSCTLSSQDLENLSRSDRQYFIPIDHTSTSTMGVWPMLDHTPDRHLQLNFDNLDLPSDEETNVSRAVLIIKHQVSPFTGTKNRDYGAKLMITQDKGENWQLLSTDIWPKKQNRDQIFRLKLPQEYLSSNSLKNFQIRLFLFGNPESENLVSQVDYTALYINHHPKPKKSFSSIYNYFSRLYKFFNRF